MKAVRLHRVRSASEPEDLRLEEVPDPEPGPGQVLVDIRACGISGSDLRLVQGQTRTGDLPKVLGHEAAGIVAAVGDGVDGWLPGDRVAAVTVRFCGRCGYCTTGRENLCERRRLPGVDLDGTMAEFAVVDVPHLVPVPSTIPFEQAAVLTDAVATPYHALKRGGIGEGVMCVVYGLGGLGLHAVQLARLAGATVIGVDIDPVALERGPEWGTSAVVDASDGDPHLEVLELTRGGADRAFEFVGTRATVDQALRSVARGGRVTVVGLTSDDLELMPTARLVADEVELVGSFGSTPADLNELVDLAEAGRLDLTRSVTHQISLEEVPDALGWLESREDEHPVRVVITAPA